MVNSDNLPNDGISEIDDGPEFDPDNLEKILFNGSTINIYDIDRIIDEVRGEKKVILEVDDFNGPISKLSVFAGTRGEGGDEAVVLDAVFELDPSRFADSNVYGRFKHSSGRFGRWTRESLKAGYPERHGFSVDNARFSNVREMFDPDDGSRASLIWYSTNNTVHLKNNEIIGKRYHEDDLVAAPISASDYRSHFISHMRAMISVADFLNTFDTNLSELTGDADNPNLAPDEIPLTRVYNVGEVVREIDPFSQLEQRVGSMIARVADPKTPYINTADSGQLELEQERHNSVQELASFDDIVGIDKQVATLKMAARTLKNPELADKWGVDLPQGILLYGPAGVGKTMLAGALAKELGGEMREVDSSDIYNKWTGKSEAHLSTIFDEAEKTKVPLVLFFDEFDTVIQSVDGASRDDSGAMAVAAVEGIFKTRVPKLREINPLVLVVAATNKDLDDFDQSLIRSGRFDLKIGIPMPNVDGRKQIAINTVFKLVTSLETETFKPFADEIDFDRVAELTYDMSPADIVIMFSSAKLAKFNEEAVTFTDPGPITQADIEQAIVDFRRSTGH